MTRDEYNARIQAIQKMWPAGATRIDKEYDTRGRAPVLKRAVFEVYWSGRWHSLGWETDPLTTAARRGWNETLELKLRGAFAGELMKS